MCFSLIYIEKEKATSEPTGKYDIGLCTDYLDIQSTDLL